MSILIAIGGVSRSGKSTLADWLGSQLKNATVLHQDEYAKPKDQLPLINGLPNWEVPESINWKAWEKAIAQAQTEFDYVIIEGILVFSNPEINQKINHSIELKISKEEFVSRRLLEKRWGDEPKWFVEYVWDAYLEYGIPPSDLKAIKIQNLTQENYAEVLAEIRKQS